MYIKIDAILLSLTSYPASHTSLGLLQSNICIKNILYLGGQYYAPHRESLFFFHLFPPPSQSPFAPHYLPTFLYTRSFLTERFCGVLFLIGIALVTDPPTNVPITATPTLGTAAVLAEVIRHGVVCGGVHGLSSSSSAATIRITELWMLPGSGGRVVAHRVARERLQRRV